MIVNNREGGEIISNGVSQQKVFTLKANGKAFKALSDTLYKNKIGSIVRELSCNAYDSHVEAGKADVPFDIHLPNHYEPTFYIKDYGVGMSRETIETIFSTYFETTKDGSNEGIGGYGLGGKTPFSMVDSYNIISVYNGKKYFYTAMIDEQDVPTLSLFSETDTDECNGVTVEMNVDSGDFHRFRDEVEEQLRFFKVKPRILNGEIEFEDIEIVEEFGNIKVFRETPSSNFRGMYIVQGGVCYRLDKNQLNDKVADKEKLKILNALDDFIMFFNIGDIEVTISREDISYSRRTIESIERFIDTHVPLIVDKIKEKLESDEISIWDKMAYLNDNFHIGKIARFLNLDGKVKDKATNFHPPYGFKIKEDAQYILSYAWKHKDSTRKGSGGHVIVPDHNTKIIINDVKGHSFRIKEFLKSQDEASLFIFSHRDGINAVNQKFINGIKSMLGGCQVIRASSLPAPTNTHSAKKKTVVAYVYRDTGNNIGSLNKWDKVYDKETMTDGYYLTYDTYPRVIIDGYNIRSLIHELYVRGQFDKPIYCVKSDKEKELLKTNPNLIPMNAALDKILEKIIKKADKVINVDKFLLYSELLTLLDNIETPLLDFVAAKRAHKIFPKTNYINKYCRLRQIAQKYIDRCEKSFKDRKYHSLLETYSNSGLVRNRISEKLNQISKKVIDEHNNWVNKYPMLKLLKVYYSIDMIDACYVVNQYMQLIDMNNP